MKRIIITIFLMLTLSIAYGDVVIYKIWSPYDVPNTPTLHVDVSNQILYLGIVNKDDYEHDVIVEVKCNGKTWRSGIIPLPPNNHLEKIVEVKVPIVDDKEHDVDVLLVENGKTIASKTVKVKGYFPIDVKNVTCENSYKSGDSEVCYSNWFDVLLKSNPTAQSDYTAKVWINVKSGGDTVYSGKDDAKTVYIPLGGEVKVSFKVPKIVLDRDRFTIETNVNVMNVTHTVEGIEETIQKRGDDGVYYEYKSFTKYYYLPVIIKNVELYRKIDGNTSKMVKKFYESSGIIDKYVEKALSDQYFQDKDVLPRYYIIKDPTLAILKISLENLYNQNVDSVLLIRYNNRTIKRIINIDKESTKDVFVPIYVKKGSVYVNVTAYPKDEDGLVFNKGYTVNINPYPVPPVIIDKMSLPVDRNIGGIINNFSGYVVIGKRYNMSVYIENIYNKTLHGKLTISDDFKRGVVNYTKDINFTIYPHQIKKIDIPIIFYKEVNGDLKITASVKDGAKNYVALAHFYAISPVTITKVYYNNTLLLGRVNVINGSGGIYVNKPVAGFNNTCVVEIRNNLHSKLNCEVWVEVINRNGKVMAKSNVKNVCILNSSEVKVTFPIYFGSGFNGYTIVHVIPKSLENVDVIYTEGYGIHLVQIPEYYKVGRYSAVDLLGNSVLTGTHVVTEVISPINIKDIKFSNNNSTLILKIENERFPVNLTVYCWAEVTNRSHVYYKSPTFKVEVYPKCTKTLAIPLNLKNLTGGVYNITVYAKVNNFALYGNREIPVVLKKLVPLKINSTKKTDVYDNGENETLDNKINHSVTNMYNNKLYGHSKIPETLNTSLKVKSVKINLVNKSEGGNTNSSIFDEISGIFRGIVSGILGLFGGA